MTARIGQRFGLLTVQSRDDAPGKWEKWLCSCDCGESRIVRAKSLLSGAMRSCGCQTWRRRQELTRDQQRFELAVARSRLAEAQTALDLADHHDTEAIASARHALDGALKRVRDLLSWRANTTLGKGRPGTDMHQTNPEKS
jgi:hypothetical protein